ncbi:MAG: ABC transporter substrate-binding protein [Phycisphaerales bacterium]|nr:ABC transporter substrate-binding protein [Phycisphaerales bacterium]
MIAFIRERTEMLRIVIQAGADQETEKRSETREGMVTIRRTHMLCTIVAVVVVGAILLRIRSERFTPIVSDTRPARIPSIPGTLPLPHDYVADPRVDPAEAGRGPRRIISMAPSITEILCALGLADRLVGRTPYCLYPPSVRSVEVVGAMMDPNLAWIKALEPDLVLATSNSGRLNDGLAALDIRYEAVPHNSIAEIHVAIERIGVLCDRPFTARQLNDGIRADLAALVEIRKAMDLPAYRTLVCLGPVPVPPRAMFVAGPGLFLDELLRMAGGTNAAADVLHRSEGELPLEVLLLLNPEVILEFADQEMPQRMTDLYQSWRSVGVLSAIEHQRIGGVGGLEWLSAGPRVALELHRFISVLAGFDRWEGQ